VATATRSVPQYCYQCVAGPDLLTVKVRDGVATEVEPNFAAAAIHPGGGKCCVKAYGLVQKTYNPHRLTLPMKRTNPRKGRDHDPRFVPISWDEALDLVAAESRRELRRRRHADLLHGDVPGVPRRVGPDRLQLRQRAGRQVLSLGASLRGAVASRVHRLPGHADVEVRALLRREHRSVGRRRRHVAPRRGARARPEAGADRAASLDHRCRVRRVGADQAEDRRGVPVQPDPCPPAPRAAGTARRPVPQGANRLALPDRPERLLPPRPRDARPGPIRK